MGKKGKVGASRKDRFYDLAKTQGLRARSAFKLSQLGHKFRLFDHCLNVLDLCAAPGGWMQIARLAIPLAGHVIGVDLVPIKAIRNCTSVVADITTSACVRTLRNVLAEKNLQKVDLVLHDGAPNVGTSWDRDAYLQNELVIKAAELATHFLAAQGTFVTKVFRSADYTKILYVLHQLFDRVQASKPSSSRAESAEIFVVCQNYKAPSKISKELFNLEKVFEDIEQVPATKIQVNEDLGAVVPNPKMGSLRAALKSLGKTSKRAKGYNPGDVYKACPLETFFQAIEPANVLVSYNLLGIDPNLDFDAAVINHPSTTSDVLEYCKDLKVLGKEEFRAILKWRMHILMERKKRAEELAKSVKDEEEEKHGVGSEVVQGEAAEELLDDNLNVLIQKSAKEKLKSVRKQMRKFRKMKMNFKISSSVFSSESKDLKLFGNAEASTKLLEEEDKYVAVDNDDGDDKVTYENYEEVGESSGSEDESEPDEDIDYVDQLAKEMDAFHKEQKENQIMRGISTSESRKLTRREKKYKEWNAELEGFERSLEARQLQHAEGAATTDDEEEEEEEEEEKEEEKEEENEEEEKEEENEEGGAEAFRETEKSGAEACREPEAVKKRRLFTDLSASKPRDARTEHFFQSNPVLSALEEPGYFGGETEIVEIGEEEMPQIPLTDKQKQRLKRKRRMEKEQALDAKKAKADVKLLKSLGGAVDEELLARAEGTDVTKGFKEVSSAQGLKDAAKAIKDLVSSGRGGGNVSEFTKPEHFDDIAEIQAIGSLMLKKKSRMDLMDGTYNRWAFNDPPLPAWFKEDDEIARIPEIPVTKELVREYRMKLREISERPIRKVAEARARKRHHRTKALERLRGQAAKIVDNPDLDDRGKKVEVEKLTKKALRGQNAHKGKHYSICRPTGTTKAVGPSMKKGYNKSMKLVDRRLKKDKRGVKVKRPPPKGRKRTGAKRSHKK